MALKGDFDWIDLAIAHSAWLGFLRSVSGGFHLNPEHDASETLLSAAAPLSVCLGDRVTLAIRTSLSPMTAS